MQSLLQQLYPNDEDIAPTETNFPRWVEEDDVYAPFIPTSMTRCIKALTMAACKPEDIVVDLGSGDGRFCAAAASVFGCLKAVGFESDPQLVSKATSLWKTLCNSQAIQPSAVELLEKDFRNTDDPDVKQWLDRATVVVVFLSPEFAKDFASTLVTMFHRGVRIVALCFNLSEIPELQLKQGCEGVDDVWVYEKC